MPGVGKRTAERMALELKDKVGPATDPGAPEVPAASAAGSSAAEVSEALEGLGFSSAEAEKAATVVLESAPELEPAEALRLALRSLGKR